MKRIQSWLTASRLLWSIAALSVLWAFGVSPSVLAAAAGGKYIGLELGYGTLTSGGGTVLNYGVSAGVNLAGLGLGAFFDNLPRGTLLDSTGEQASGSLYVAGVEGLVSLPFWPGGSLGARLGWLSSSTAFIDQLGNETDETHSGFCVGPIVAYDFPIGNSLTVGGQAYYLVTSASVAPDLVGLQATLKFWF